LNAEGFLGYWPTVANDENADPRDRAYAKWLVETEKVVFSSTLATSPWERTQIVNAAPQQVLVDLMGQGSGEILVNSSPSIIKPLLGADLIDRLFLMITPEIAGGGARLFDDGVPGTKWSLEHHETGTLGEMAVIYDRIR
jgi:dihydrofolate reductase